MIHVVVVAPALAVRTGLRSLFSAGEAIEVVAEASTLAEALPLDAGTDLLVLATEPLLLADAVQALQGSESVPVLFLVSGEADPGLIARRLQPSPWGILPLDSSAEELAAAVNALYEGLLVVASAFWKHWMDRAAQPLRIGEEPLSSQLEEGTEQTLTEREAQVLQLLAQGLANKQIAAHLGISEHTVKFHVSSVFTKLGATSRTEAVRLGARRGLVVL